MALFRQASLLEKLLVGFPSKVIDKLLPLFFLSMEWLFCP